MESLSKKEGANTLGPISLVRIDRQASESENSRKFPFLSPCFIQRSGCGLSIDSAVDPRKGDELVKNDLKLNLDGHRSEGPRANAPPTLVAKPFGVSTSRISKIRRGG